MAGFIDERKITELVTKQSPTLEDFLLLEDIDGTKLVSIENVKALLAANLIVPTLDLLKSATFNEGEICHTLGYHEIGDGGGAKYHIVYRETARTDERIWIELNTSDTLRAKFIPEYGRVTPEQFGAYGDGVHDDTEAVNECIKTGLSISFSPNKTYFVRCLQLHSDMTLDLCGATFKGEIFKDVTDSGSQIKYSGITIKNGTIDCMKSNTPIYLTCATDDITIEDISFINSASSYGAVLIDNCKSLLINKCKFEYTNISNIADTHCAIRLDGYTKTQTNNTTITLLNSYINGFCYGVYADNGLTTNKMKVLNVLDCTFDNVKRNMVNVRNKFTYVGISNVNGKCFSEAFKVNTTNMFTTVNIENVNISANTLFSGAGNNRDYLFVLLRGSIEVECAIFIENVTATIDYTGAKIRANDSIVNILRGNNTDFVKVIGEYPSKIAEYGAVSPLLMHDRIEGSSGVKDYLTAQLDDYFLNYSFTLSSSTATILRNITGGCIGQMIRLSSDSNNITVADMVDGNIRLLSTSIQLSKYKSIVLQKIGDGDNGIWVQL